MSRCFSGNVSWEGAFNMCGGKTVEYVQYSLGEKIVLGVVVVITGIVLGLNIIKFVLDANQVKDNLKVTRGGVK